MKLYLPISSKNFSVIFETESVSPRAFYQERTFGNTRFRHCPLELSDDYITLYSEPALLHDYVGCFLTVFGIPNLLNRFRQAALT